jgi:hypothetical protein
MSHHTSSSKLSFEKHNEKISLDIILLDNYDIVLDIPWLKQHNPRINWARQILELGKGLPLARSATLESVKRKIAFPEMLVAILKKYHDFRFLFESSAANVLLEYKP